MRSASTSIEPVSNPNDVRGRSVVDHEPVTELFDDLAEEGLDEETVRLGVVTVPDGCSPDVDRFYRIDLVRDAVVPGIRCLQDIMVHDGVRLMK